MGSTFAATGLVLAVLAATGSCRSHHRLTIPVPPQLVPFNSSAGMALLLEPQTAQASFFSLVQELATQETQSYCGVASAATMLNALPNVPAPVDPVFSPHPYFTQDSFFSDCVNKVVPSSTVKLVGMTLDQWHAAVHCWGPTVATTHASDSSVDAFRTAASTALAKGRVSFLEEPRVLRPRLGYSHAPFRPPRPPPFSTMDVCGVA